MEHISSEAPMVVLAMDDDEAGALKRVLQEWIDTNLEVEVMEYNHDKERTWTTELKDIDEVVERLTYVMRLVGNYLELIDLVEVFNLQVKMGYLEARATFDEIATAIEYLKNVQNDVQ